MLTSLEGDKALNKKSYIGSRTGPPVAKRHKTRFSDEIINYYNKVNDKFNAFSFINFRTKKTEIFYIKRRGLCKKEYLTKEQEYILKELNG